MKILFDSNILALTFLQNIQMHRTGIFRYAENMVRGLRQFENVEIGFYSSLDKEEKNLWEKKIEETQYLKNIPIFNYRHPLKKNLDNLNESIMEATNFQKFWLKSYRESLRIIIRSSSAFSFGNEANKKLEEYDIFFSPYHPIPKGIQLNKNILCFTAVHDLIPLKYPKFFKVDKRAFFDQIFKRALPNHFFLALSESTKADICHYYSINPEKIFVVHSAPQDDLFKPVEDKEAIAKVKKKYGITKDYILSLATLEPRKNIPFLIDAFKKLIQENPNLNLNLVLTGSKGWGFDEIIHRIKPFEDRILITGFVKDEDLKMLYSGALAFAYPSLYEGFGLPPLEAMRCNTPVIVSDRSSLPEVVADAGLYVDPTNIDDMTKQLHKLVTSSSLRENLKEKGKEQIAKFTWEKNAEAALKAFEMSLKKVG